MYFPKKNFECEHFTLEVFPFINPPENIFSEGEAIQYGADFKIMFNRQGKHTKNLQLLQFILPQTNVGTNIANTLNIDKHVDNGASIDACLYGRPENKINSGEKYKGEFMCGRGTTSCFSIDTPREFSNRIDRKTGQFTGSMLTEFSHFVVELAGSKSFIFKNGIKWSYNFEQHEISKKELYNFISIINEPKKITNWNTYKTVLDNKNILYATD